MLKKRDVITGRTVKIKRRIKDGPINKIISFKLFLIVHLLREKPSGFSHWAFKLLL